MSRSPSFYRLGGACERCEADRDRGECRVMSISNVFVLLRHLLWKAKLDLSALGEGLDSSHINVSFSMGSIASCGVMKIPLCNIHTG